MLSLSSSKAYTTSNNVSGFKRALEKLEWNDKVSKVKAIPLQTWAGP
jgi:hypothetical protein